MDSDDGNHRLAGIMLSRTLFLAMRIEDSGDIDAPVYPKSLLNEECATRPVTPDTARDVLEDLITNHICRNGWFPSVICIGTYGAYKQQTKTGHHRIEGIADSVDGPLKGCDLRTLLEEVFKNAPKKPLIVIDTDVGVYAVGENYIRALPQDDGPPQLTKNDPIIFGFFSGGVGAAVSQNLVINRGLQVGNRGKMPVFPHQEDVKIGFQSPNEFPLSLAAMTDAISIRQRAKQLDGLDGNLRTLMEHPAAKTWTVVAYYIAQFCFAAMVNYSPRLIVLGGRTITWNTFMIDKVRSSYRKVARCDFPTIAFDPGDPETLIQPPHSLETSVYGCLEVAKQELRKARMAQ